MRPLQTRPGVWSDSQAASLAGRLTCMRTFVVAVCLLRAVIQIVSARNTRPGIAIITQMERA
eukprot:51982-Amphidinium_carterae.1